MKVLVAGARGAVGAAAVRLLLEAGHSVRGLVRTTVDGDSTPPGAEFFQGDARHRHDLDGLCSGADVVISALGKPVSLFSGDDSSFDETDFHGNANLLREAVRHRVRRFIYISIFGSERYGDGFALARAHRDFEEVLRISGLSYAILRPVGLFSGMVDLLEMARRGGVITVGRGEARTNPIHFEDLAHLAVSQLEGENVTLEAGGPEIFTRWELGEMACRLTGCDLHIRLPDLAVRAGLPFLPYFNRNFFDKLAFFEKVLTEDAIAPCRGVRRLEEFLRAEAEKRKAA